MLNLDPGKLLVIGVVAIILLGPDRLPQVARQIGGAWRTFNEFRHRMESEVRDTMPDLPSTSEIARLARSPSALLNHLSNMASDEEPDGAFQPPDLERQHGPRGGHERDDSRRGPSRRGEPTAMARPQGPTPAPPSTPAPIHVERPTRAPKPSGVVVPGDPTLN